mgnify:CR=1 FL=1
MNNTDELLRAFIEASGYEIKEVAEPFSEPGCCVRVADYKVTKKMDVALSLLREIVDGDDEYTNEYNLGVDLFKRIKELTNV